MLTSFFGKSSPINYLILGVFISFGYILRLFSTQGSEFDFSSFVEYIAFMVVSFFSMLLLDFIIRKNLLTKNNTYAILFFSCFMVAIPTIFLDRNILMANVFILLALRRILSLRTDKNIEKKILDTSIWIIIASFFYFWSILFYFALYFALLSKPNTNHKQLLIPIVGFLGICTIAGTCNLLITDSFNWFYDLKSTIGLDFFAYNESKLFIPVAIIGAFLIWAGISVFLKLPSIKKRERPNAFILVVALILTILIGLGSNLKTGAEMLFLLGPLSIIITNYIENTKEFWFKEILLWLVILLPITVFFL